MQKQVPFKKKEEHIKIKNSVWKSKNSTTIKCVKSIVNLKAD